MKRQMHIFVIVSSVKVLSYCKFTDLPGPRMTVVCGALAVAVAAEEKSQRRRVRSDRGREKRKPEWCRARALCLTARRVGRECDARTRERGRLIAPTMAVMLLVLVV